MLKIKLTRIGKKKQPFFRIIVAEARSKVNGMFNDIIGWYDPLKQTKSVDMEKYNSWVKQGAQATDSVKMLVLSREEKEKLWPSKPKKEKTEKA